MVVQLDGEDVAGAGGESTGDGALTGADLGDGSAGDVTHCGRDAGDGLFV